MEALVRKAVSPYLLKYLRYAKLRALEAVGQKNAAFTALHDLDRKFLRQSSLQRPGFFIEVGANDGVLQSNTYALERLFGWNGLLIEPVPQLAELCRKFRPRSHVVNCALGTREADGSEIEIFESGTMSTVASVSDVAERIQRSESFTKRPAKKIRVPVRALSNILDELAIQSVDLLSVDVEGFELELLAGLDITRHRPRWILVETAQFDAVARQLRDGYAFVEQLSQHDYLLARTAA